MRVCLFILFLERRMCMELSEITRPGVGQYISQPGALTFLDSSIQLFKQPLIITGDKAYHAFNKFYPQGRRYSVLFYDQSASHENIESLVNNAPSGTDLIIGVGGGKALDTAKGVANKLQVEYVMIPTVLGTCAACTPLSVIYHPDHTFKTVDYYPKAAFLTIVDTDLLIESPLKYLQSGIGDTLAKWYEAIALAEKLPLPWSTTIALGLSSAQLSRETLLNDGAKAIESIQSKQLSDAFQRIVDTIFLIAASVGGFAGSYGRIAGAHAVHNGLTLLPETASIEHGVKVAYGILVQIATLGNREELNTLLPFYHANHFPTTLKQLGVTEDLPNKISQVATYAASNNESFILAKPDLTADNIIKGMTYLENLASRT